MCFKYIPNDGIICTLFEFSMANVHKENCIYISRTIIDIIHTAGGDGLLCGTGHTRAKKQKSKTKRRIYLVVGSASWLQDSIALFSLSGYWQGKSLVSRVV